MKVKICGNKRVKDALQAIYLGADAVGLLVGQVHASTDFITPETAAYIVKKLPPFCSSVLVTHLNDISEILPLAKYTGVTTIQLHGDSTPEDISEIKKSLPYIKIIKSLHIIDSSSIRNGKKFIPLADAILLDTINTRTDQIGGTGKTHDWNISTKIVQEYKIPIILAGGLNPDNIEEAIKTVRPFGVDVNSGVKDKEGFKDYSKLKLFISKAKNLV